MIIRKNASDFRSLGTHKYNFKKWGYNLLSYYFLTLKPIINNSIIWNFLFEGRYKSYFMNIFVILCSFRFRHLYYVLLRKGTKLANFKVVDLFCDIIGHNYTLTMIAQNCLFELSFPSVRWRAQVNSLQPT